MVVGLFGDLTIVNDQAYSSGARFSHKETTDTMAGLVPVSIFLNEASIYTFLDLAFHLVNSVLWTGVRMPSYHRPFKLWFEFEVHLNWFLARQGWGQLRRPKQVHFCTGVSANFDSVTCLIYLLFAEGKLKQSALWSNYPQKCMFLAQNSICWIWQITYISLVEAQNLGYFELHTPLCYFRTSEGFVSIFFLQPFHAH